MTRMVRRYGERGADGVIPVDGGQQEHPSHARSAGQALSVNLVGSERHRFASFRTYRSSPRSSRLADMLVAAQVDATVFGIHLGSSEGARVPGRVCCGGLAFRRLVCIVVL